MAIMDPVLARMFDLDRPLAVRMADRDLQEDFVKSASQIGIDLTKLADADVDQLWRYHKGYRMLQADMITKEASWVRMGRGLAHQYVDQLTNQGMMKQAQVDPTGLHTSFLQGFLGDPRLRSRLYAQPESIAAMVGAGLDPDKAKEFLKGDPRFWTPDVLDPTGKIVTPGRPTSLGANYEQIIDEARKTTGAAAQRQKYQAGMPTTPVSGSALRRQALLEGIGVPPAQATGFWSKYGPSGLMKAITEGNWGTALRKGLPVAGLGVGALMLMKRKSEQERERQLALGSMASAPGAVPMAGYPRLGPGAAG